MCGQVSLVEGAPSILAACGGSSGCGAKTVCDTPVQVTPSRSPPERRFGVEDHHCQCRLLLRGACGAAIRSPVLSVHSGAGSRLACGVDKNFVQLPGCPGGADQQTSHSVADAGSSLLQRLGGKERRSSHQFTFGCLLITPTFYGPRARASEANRRFIDS